MQIASAPCGMTSQQQRFPSLDGEATSLRDGELASVDRLDVRQFQDPDLQRAEELRQLAGARRIPSEYGRAEDETEAREAYQRSLELERREIDNSWGTSLGAFFHG